MKILFFGKLGGCAGREIDLELEPEGCTVAELRARLALALPQAANELVRTANRACVDQEFALETTRILPWQEVAFIPPLSGG